MSTPIAIEPQHQQRKNLSEVVTLKYPIDIKNLKVKEVMIPDQFGCSKQKVYDPSSFSSIKYILQQQGRKIAKEYPGYQYRIYMYRAVLKGKFTWIPQIKFNFNVSDHSHFVHVNVELLSEDPGVDVEDEVSDLSDNEDTPEPGFE